MNSCYVWTYVEFYMTICSAWELIFLIDFNNWKNIEKVEEDDVSIYFFVFTWRQRQAIKAADQNHFILIKFWTILCSFLWLSDANMFALLEVSVRTSKPFHPNPPPPILLPPRQQISRHHITKSIKQINPIQKFANLVNPKFLINIRNIKQFSKF